MKEKGIGALWLLTIVLVVLRALGYIGWPWLWVFAPAILSVAIGFLVLTFVLGIVLIKVLTD